MRATIRRSSESEVQIGQRLTGYKDVESPGVNVQGLNDRWPMGAAVVSHRSAETEHSTNDSRSPFCNVRPPLHSHNAE